MIGDGTGGADGSHEAKCRREGVAEGLEDSGGLPDDGSVVGRNFIVVR